MCLVTATEFEAITGSQLGAFWGRASREHRIIAVKYNRSLFAIKATLWHELAHVLFPSKPHWWVECFAAKMLPGADIGRYSRRYNHTPYDLPSKTKLLQLARKAANKLTDLGQ